MKKLTIGLVVFGLCFSGISAKLLYAEDEKPVISQEVNAMIQAVELTFQQIKDGTITGEDAINLLLAQQDQMLLAKNMKEQELKVATKDMPCGALSDKIKLLRAEIDAFDQEIAKIDAQVLALQQEKVEVK
ncbi:MAG: hypothetical protein V1893_01415 [Candidatus Omnitrophota bacterium]